MDNLRDSQGTCLTDFLPYALNFRSWFLGQMELHGNSTNDENIMNCKDSHHSLATYQPSHHHRCILGTKFNLHLIFMTILYMSYCDTFDVTF